MYNVFEQKNENSSTFILSDINHLHSFGFNLARGRVTAVERSKASAITWERNIILLKWDQEDNLWTL